MTWDSPTNNELLRENRTLRWQAKHLGKQLGKQGRTIFQLRNECASLRIANQLTPGDYQRLLAQLREVQAENAQLREKLAARDKVQVGDNMYAQTQAQADAVNDFIETGGLPHDAMVDSHTPTRDLDA